MYVLGVVADTLAILYIWILEAKFVYTQTPLSLSEEAVFHNRTRERKL
jgi:hypothetical protein